MHVLLTGGSRGIGRAIAERLAVDGARIVFSYLQNADAAAETVRSVEELGGTAWAVASDVRSPRACKDFVAEAEARLGSVDALIHNAAIGALKPMEKLRTSQWDLTLESSLRPFWLLTKLALPLMSEGSSIIGLSSLGSRQYTPGYAAMGAAKGGLEALTRQLAVELAPDIRVNTVCGGLVDTDALKHLPEGERMREEIGEITPLGGIARPEHIAGAVAMLLSDDARWVTGHVLVADGGFSCL